MSRFFVVTVQTVGGGPRVKGEKLTISPKDVPMRGRVTRSGGTSALKRETSKRSQKWECHAAEGRSVKESAFAVLLRGSGLGGLARFPCAFSQGVAKGKDF